MQNIIQNEQNTRLLKECKIEEESMLSTIKCLKEGGFVKSTRSHHCQHNCILWAQKLFSFLVSPSPVQYIEYLCVHSLCL